MQVLFFKRELSDFACSIMESYGIMSYGIPMNPNGFNTISQHNDRFSLKEEIVWQFIANVSDRKEL